MPKIILSTLLVLFACSGLSMANECQIKEINPNVESNGFTFKTTLQRNLSVHTPQPKEALLTSDGVIYIYGEDNIIGFMTVREKFQKQETIEKTFQKTYLYNCSEPIMKINKSNFDVYIINNYLNDRPSATVIIVNKADDSYFYLLSFVGFSKDQATQMLSGK